MRSILKRVVELYLKTIRFAMDGRCKGARPVEGIDEIASEPWYHKLIQCIKNGDENQAIELANANFSAEYITENLPILEESGIAYVGTESVFLRDPYIEQEGDNGEIALFGSMGARFLMEAPSQIVDKWLVPLEDGSKAFSEDRFSDWLGTDTYLQDGCAYHLGSCWYDLDGFGENGCRIDGNSIKLDQYPKKTELDPKEDAQDHAFLSRNVAPKRLEGVKLLSKIKELGDVSKSELARQCGYVSIDGDGREELHLDVFYEAMMNAKFDAMS